MKKIIVPVDFSKHSEYALEAAAMLARKNGAEILALHMLELSNAIISEDDNSKQAEAVFYLKLAEQKFTEFLDRPFLEDVSVTPIVKHFKVFSEVNEIAQDHSVDLIVMGSHGSSGIKELFIGSNTEKVVRHSEIPVLVIKNRPESANFEKVVFACDFSREAIRPYINASKVFQELGASLHLVYVNLPGTSFQSSAEMEKKVVDFLTVADGNIDNLEKVHYINDYSIEKGVLNFANSISANLIAVATHGRTGLAHFFEGSISEDIANHATLPVMTFKI
ncbi:universal stress protein [Kordia zhangzhouensis]|uniref:universal stress protein n=1 Tax=Kordia zhangzhouensis TaxID=1620405 RepID=UPI0006294C12|nr:universal stress protein [Kordia zhangzhouensis]